MIVKTFLHLDHKMTMVSKNELLTKMMENGTSIMKPEHQSTKPHMLVIQYDEEKIPIHDIPVLAGRFGVRSEIVDL